MKYSKINIDRAPLSKMDVEQGMDFTQVLKGLNKAHLPWYKSTAFISSSIIVLAVVVVVGGWMMYQNAQVHSETSQQPTELGAETVVIKDCVDPPVEGMNKSFMLHTVNTTADTTLVIDDSRVMIPANAFVAADGHPVDGEVDVLYREYHNKYDVIFSGIPMGYDSAGTHYQFESAGMFEIRGKKDGEDVFLAPEQEIVVEMSTGNAGDEFNSYTFNEETSAWEYLGESVVVIETVDEAQPIVTNFNLEPGKQKLVQREDGSLDWVSSPDSSIRYGSQEVEVVELETWDAVAMPEIKTSEPLKPVKASSGNYQINFDYDKEEFPELAVYDNMLFEVSETNKNFQKDQADKVWNDIKIRRGAEEGSYVLTFSRPGDRFSVLCYPVVDGTNMDAAMAKYEQAMKDYEKKEEQLKEEQEEREAEARAAAVKRRQAVRDAQEIADTTAGFYSDSYTRMYRVFAVTKLGIYNSDCGRMYPSEQAIMAEYHTPEGDEVQLMNLYLVDNNRNMSFAMPTNRISFNRMTEYSIVGVTSEGDVAYSKLGRIQQVCESSSCDLTVKIIDKEVSSVRKLQELLEEENIM